MAKKETVERTDSANVAEANSEAAASDALQTLLAEFREDARNNRDLGDKFERLMQSYFTKEPLYADLFSNVWLWMEWPGRDKKGDRGIDIVAEERATGDLWAIQAKFYLPEHTLSKGDIDSFFTESGKKPFSKRMIVSTTDRWGKNAQDALSGQQIEVKRLGLGDLMDSVIDWSDYSAAKPHKVKLLKKKKLRAHQKEALTNVVKGFKNSDRGKLIMACGTGKTFTSLKIAEKMAPKGGAVLFLMPSISLISQSIGEWASECKVKAHYFAVCSDPKVGRKGDAEDISSFDLAYPAHTKPKILADQFSRG